jgi:formate--tetrahydrofolate ligase
MAALDKLCKAEGVECVVADNWGSGGAGAADLARAVVNTIETQPSNFKPLYPDDMPLAEKVRTIAKELYGAADISYDSSIKARFAELEKEGFGNFPVCIAKTQYSFSTDANAKGAPSAFTIPIRELRLSAGAEFIVVVCGDIMTMPGLPKVPAANNIYVDDSGRIAGLF